jgi:ParB family transcriptional regulator, chromosome partitioning protein
MATVSHETTRPSAKRNGTPPADPPAQLVKAVIQIDLDRIDVGPNVRVDVADVDELAASIKEHGVLQPIKVRPAGDRWVIVWGQRRYLAARQAGLQYIPAITTAEVADGAQLSIEQLVENLHRADLNPVDRARAMRQVVDAGMSQADLARDLGLAPSTIANELGILAAPKAVLSLIEDGKLTPAHQRAMKGLDPKSQAQLARDAVANGYSAHRTEEEVQRRRQSAEAETKRKELDAAEDVRKKAGIEASIANDLPKKKVGKDDTIVVDFYYNGEAEARRLAGLLTAAGYPNARVAKSYGEVQPRPTGGVCDCAAWKASPHTEGGRYDYNTGRAVGATYSIRITRACIVPKHVQAKATADRKAEVDKYALEQKVQAHVVSTAFAEPTPIVIGGDPQTGGGHIEQGIAIQRLLAEAALWGLLSYRLPDWSEAHGGKRNTAWTVIRALSDEDLASELAKEIARDFRDKAGYHIDWPKLAEDLGLVGTTAASAATEEASS